MLSNLRQRLAALVGEMPPTFWYLWAGTIINRLGGFAIPFLMLYLTSQLAMTPARAAFLVSLIGAGSFLAHLIGGELTDRLGRRPVMLLSFLITPVALILVGVERSGWLLPLSMPFLGFFLNLYRPAVNAAVADLVPAEKRTRAYGYLYWAINIGYAIAPLLAGLMATYDYFLLFFGDALTTLAFGVIVFLRIPETRPKEAGEAAQVTFLTRARQVTHEPVLLWFTLLSFFVSMIYTQSQVTLPVAMQDRGLLPIDFGLVNAVNGVLIVLVTLQAARLLEKWPRFAAMGLAALLTGAGFGLNHLAATLPMYAVAVAVWTLGEIVSANVAPVIISDLAPLELRGLYLGIYGSFGWGLAFFIGPVLGGWVYETYGSAVLWGGCFVLGLLLLGAYLLLGIPAARRARPPAAADKLA